MPRLNWIGRNAVVNHHFDVPFHFLDRKYGGGRNMIIHGDNLLALKSLLPKFEGKIKCIYIDPPYNTGNEDRVYNDAVSHDKWLCMMYPRIRLLQMLLADDGAIFISIDDNEQANLKLICNEIFGERNFISQITVAGNPRGRDYGGIARMHDYVLVYRKTLALKLNLIEDDDGKFKSFDALGGFELRELRNRNVKFNDGNRPNLYYPFYVDVAASDENGLHEISLEPKDGRLELYPSESQGVKTVWRWGREKSAANLNINIMAKPMKNGGYMIVEKYREARKMARSVWCDKDVNTEKGTLLVKNIFGGKVFDYPKPVEMIERILSMATDKSSLVLDAFAGSGTTAHAVINLNRADGGNRKFILIESQPYAETIIAERVRRVDPECNFGYYEIGARLFLDNGMLNPDIPLEQLREYVYFTETRQPLPHSDRQFLLGIHDGRAIYFLYDPARELAIDDEFVFSTLDDGAESRVIYAERTFCGERFLQRYNTTFKRIAADILRM